MLLTVDIGNTNIVIGAFVKEELQFEYRLQSDLKRTVDEYRIQVCELISSGFSDNVSFSGAIICSVVPPLTAIISKVIQDSFSITPLEVGPGIKTGVSLKVSDPTQVGADRVVNSLAVRKRYGSKALVVDFGTATTFDYINDKGEYEGGVIAPGLYLSLESLVTNTAKLPRIDLIWPNKIIGKNTVQAMQSGALVGYVSMVDGIVSEIEKEVGGLDYIVATGGLGKLISQHSRKIKSYDKNLTLHGIRLVYDQNIR